MDERRVFQPFAKVEERVFLDSEAVRRWGLREWARQFKLGTAGYRDLLNPQDIHATDVPFNSITMAIVTAASCDLYKPGDAVHIGGEVRPWTQEFIDLAARIYAARGVLCHLRGGSDEDGPILTTPIWLSSFGVFFEGLGGGENFTASHSQSYKGGRKPMDSLGMQLIEQASAVEAGVSRIVGQAADGPGVEIVLAPSDSPLILRDFDPVDTYAEYLKSIVPATLVEDVKVAGGGGFSVAICTEGGSMGRTTRQLFRILGIPVGEGGVVRYVCFEEDPGYHGIGVLGGVNYGVDPGKPEIYKHVGAGEILSHDRAWCVFLWDPDGDRFNMATKAPANLQYTAEEQGLETEPLRDGEVLVYFKPNQIYFMLLAFRLEQELAQGGAGQRPWVLMETYPTSRSLAELAEAFGVPTFFTPVGFKHFGHAVASMEGQIGTGAASLELTDALGAVHRFPPETRVLLMAEESGGAAMGGTELFPDRSGTRRMLAMKEKDGFQVGLTAMALGARLFADGGCFAGYYLDRLEKYAIRSRFYERRDVTLFDESLKGDARRAAMDVGNRRKEATVSFFRNLADRVRSGSMTASGAGETLAGMARGMSIPPVENVFWAGDGTFIQFAGLWWQLRASGTDAVLRYYAEGESRKAVHALLDTMTGLHVAGI